MAYAITVKRTGLHECLLLGIVQHQCAVLPCMDAIGTSVFGSSNREYIHTCAHVPQATKGRRRGFTGPIEEAESRVMQSSSFLVNNAYISTVLAS
jgi:hypothetical protein